MDHALRDPGCTHVWVMDDDALATPGALPAMLDALKVAHAECVAPLITDDTDHIRWFPGPLPQPEWDLLRSEPTVEEFLKRSTNRNCCWKWAIWASLVISRRAIESVGLPRLDLWSQFSDLEYTLRISSRLRCVLAPHAICRHIPFPEPSGPSRTKLYSAIQNATYVTIRLPHGRGAVRHLPGLFYRYVRHFSWQPRAWLDLLSAFIKGAVFAQTAVQWTHRMEFQRAVRAFPLRNRIRC